jgi:hypothetical protein
VSADGSGWRPSNHRSGTVRAIRGERYRTVVKDNHRIEAITEPCDSPSVRAHELITSTCSDQHVWSGFTAGSSRRPFMCIGAQLAKWNGCSSHNVLRHCSKAFRRTRSFKRVTPWGFCAPALCSAASDTRK